MISRLLNWLAHRQRKHYGLDDEKQRTEAVLKRTGDLIDEQAQHTRQAERGDPISSRLRASPHANGGYRVSPP